MIISYETKTGVYFKQNIFITDSSFIDKPLLNFFMTEINFILTMGDRQSMKSSFSSLIFFNI